MKAGLYEFVQESNRIEGIRRRPTPDEIEVTEDFTSLTHLTVGTVETLVKVLQPGARLRRFPGLDVRVGSYYPPKGGTHIEAELIKILDDANRPVELSAYGVHLAYEGLHPFTDGNGRSGRAIWLWMMLRSGSPRDEDMALGLGFLHCWYYQTLQATGKTFGLLPR